MKLAQVSLKPVRQLGLLIFAILLSSMPLRSLFSKKNRLPHFNLFHFYFTMLCFSGEPVESDPANGPIMASRGVHGFGEQRHADGQRTNGLENRNPQRDDGHTGELCYSVQETGNHPTELRADRQMLPVSYLQRGLGLRDQAIDHSCGREEQQLIAHLSG